MGWVQSYSRHNPNTTATQDEMPEARTSQQVEAEERYWSARPTVVTDDPARRNRLDRSVGLTEQEDAARCQNKDQQVNQQQRDDGRNEGTRNPSAHEQPTSRPKYGRLDVKKLPPTAKASSTPPDRVPTWLERFLTPSDRQALYTPSRRANDNSRRLSRPRPESGYSRKGNRWVFHLREHKLRNRCLVRRQRHSRRIHISLVSISGWVGRK
ncbi:hypothetical protein K490DRAFT_64209 [Saccharata proteae CBS 121410]|uniref:Uncharacterized protein n=1 Tax=Saccharata proteae CBS 121410 TaxID=1314787 RepID=A0A6A5YAU8_9PEZI|nr:hypothetical protein K490DRAFT_64209 [Saccharata proteae CBS 121410]